MLMLIILLRVLVLIGKSYVWARAADIGTVPDIGNAVSVLLVAGYAVRDESSYLKTARSETIKVMEVEALKKMARVRS